VVFLFALDGAGNGDEDITVTLRLISQTNRLDNDMSQLFFIKD
jgi:hypothetical protein